MTEQETAECIIHKGIPATLHAGYVTDGPEVIIAGWCSQECHAQRVYPGAYQGAWYPRMGKRRSRT